MSRFAEILFVSTQLHGAMTHKLISNPKQKLPMDVDLKPIFFIVGYTIKSEWNRISYPKNIPIGTLFSVRMKNDNMYRQKKNQMPSLALQPSAKCKKPNRVK